MFRFSETNFEMPLFATFASLVRWHPRHCGFRARIAISRASCSIIVRALGNLHFAFLYHTELLHISKIHQVKMLFEGKKSRMNDARCVLGPLEG